MAVIEQSGRVARCKVRDALGTIFIYWWLFVMLPGLALLIAGAVESILPLTLIGALACFGWVPVWIGYAALGGLDGSH